MLEKITAVLFNKSSCLAAALAVTNFVQILAVNLVTLILTWMFDKPIVVNLTVVQKDQTVWLISPMSKKNSYNMLLSYPSLSRLV